MTDEDIRLIASLISEDVDDSSNEYEGLEDTDEFEEHQGWGGGTKTGEWELEEWQLNIEGIGPVWLKGRLTYERDFHKGYRGSYYQPPEPAYIEVYDPEVDYFELHSTQGDDVALWRAKPKRTFAAGRGWVDQIPAGLDPNSVVKLTGEQIEQVKEFMVGIWEQQEQEVMQHEAEVYPEPEPPEDW